MHRVSRCGLCVRIATNLPLPGLHWQRDGHEGSATLLPFGEALQERKTSNSPKEIVVDVSCYRFMHTSQGSLRPSWALPADSVHLKRNDEMQNCAMVGSLRQLGAAVQHLDVHLPAPETISAPFRLW